MRTRIIPFACVAAAASLSVLADVDHQAAKSWFNETYSNFVEVRSNKWTTSAGTWRKDSGRDNSSYVGGDGQASVKLDTRGDELKFTPTAGYKRNQLMRLDCRMSFTACRYGETAPMTNLNMQASIGMREKEDGALTFIGWKSTRDGSVLKGRWIDLSAAEVTPAEETMYDVTVETDYRCVPTRVRYSVDGKILSDAEGTSWFSTRSTLNPESNQAKHPNTVGFCGSGVVGNFSATFATNRVPRATVEFDALLRAQVGDAPTFSVTTNDGQTLSGDLSYTWYRVDAAGMREDAPMATGASHVLTEADYGHWVSVEVSDANGYAGTGKFWFSDLPVVEMTVGTAEGYTPTEDETAQTGVSYYWADDADNFTRLDVEDGTDLAPFREQYERLFVADIKAEWPTSKKETHEGTITIRGNAEYANQLNNMAFSIHVRGNSTAGADKKPYKLKLDKKADLFGLGGGVTSKHWVLLANCFDESLMRNKLCYDLSGVFGCPVWMKSEWVDVVMNGQYVGNYQLCQHIRVAEERIPILEWDGGKIAENAVKIYSSFLTKDDEAAIDSLLETNCLWMTTGKFSYGGTNFVISAKKGKSAPEYDKNGNPYVYWKSWNGGDTSGGYVFEIDSKKVKGGSSPAPSNFIQANKTSYGTLNLCIAMNTPEYLFSNESLSNYVWNTWWDLGQAWMRPDGYNTKGQHYTELADFDSMVSYWLAQYIPGNDDASSFSRYAYKDVGGKMTFGPAWDFDYGLGSLQIRIRSAATTNLDGSVTYAPIQPEKFIPGNSGNNFMGHWTADPYFTFKLYERYWATRGYLADMVRAGGLIDQYKAKIGNSARANDLRWNNRIGFWGDTNERGDVEVLREFLTRRFAWFDRQFATAGAASTNLTKTVAASTLRYERQGTLRPAFAGATANPDTVETDVVDVSAQMTLAPLSATVDVGDGAATLEVFVNGLSNGVYAVASRQAGISIPVEMFQTGETNVVAFVARKSDGSVLRRNFALVACTLPTRVAAVDGGHDVEISWLSATWSAFKAANPKTTLTAPVSYADYLAFATNASPYGKSVPLCYDYIAGTQPSELEDLLKADIAMDADGTPRISWTPDTPALRASRVYTLFGAAAVSGPWASTPVENPAAAFCETNQFFKIGVSLPTVK